MDYVFRVASELTFPTRRLRGSCISQWLCTRSHALQLCQSRFSTVADGRFTTRPNRAVERLLQFCAL